MTNATRLHRATHVFALSFSIASIALFALPQSALAIEYPFTSSASNPVLTASAAWEVKSVGEPNVRYVNGQYVMVYSGGWGAPGLGLATSPDGITWTKYAGNPIIGQGGGGYSGTAVRGDFIMDGSEYRVYFSDSTSNGNIRLATSSNGTSYTLMSTFAIAKNAVPGFSGWENTGTYFDGTNWWMLAEGHANSGPIWQICLFESTDGGLTYSFVSGPLTSLQVSSGGMYGGPRSIVKVGSVYNLWYHAAESGGFVPTEVWHATSTDLIHWTPDSGPTIPLAGNGMGMVDPDQTGDTSIVQTPAGQTYLYFDGTDNAHAVSKIGFAIYDGTLAGTPPTTGSYTELISDNSGMCLSAVDTTEGTQLEQATCTGSTLQLWDVTTEGSGYNITNEATGYVADDSGNSKTAGGVVIDWAKNGGTNQEWTFSSNGSGYYTIVNVYSGLCLDVTGASKTSGALIDQWTCNGGTNQLWKQ